MTQEASDFIRRRIKQDLDSGLVEGAIVTRFPPEPNGYLHIGHAKSICLNFGVAEEFGGYTYLRFDDTNPLQESDEYVEAIKRDVAWLGFDWSDHLTNASDYFDELHARAVELIKAGVNPVDAVVTIRDVYGLTPEQTDKVISAAINSLPAGTNTKQLVALYSTQGGQRLLVGQIGKQGIGGSGGSGGGTLVSTGPSVSPN